MFKNKHFAFFALLFSFIAGCKLFFTDDIQKKSAQQLLDNVNSMILNPSEKKDSNPTQNTSNSQNTPQNSQQQLPNTIEKEISEKPETLQPTKESKLVAAANSMTDGTTANDPKKDVQLPKEKENLTPIAQNNSASTSTNSFSNKTLLSSIEGSNSNPLNDSIIEYSGDYEYTYSSATSGSSGSMIEENDSPQYEYTDQLNKAKEQINSALEMIKNIKDIREQVKFQSMMSTSNRSTSEIKVAAKAKLNQFSKEKLSQTLKELLKITDNAKTNIENASEDYYQIESKLSQNYTTESSKKLNWARDTLHNLIKDIENKNITTYDAYTKTSGIGGYKFSEIEKLLEESKDLIQKAKNGVNL